MRTCFQEWNLVSWSFLELDSSGSQAVQPQCGAKQPQSAAKQPWSWGTARIQLQEAPGDQIPLLEAGSHFKPYSQFSCSILQLCKPLGNR